MKYYPLEEFTSRGFFRSPDLVIFVRQKSLGFLTIKIEFKK